MNFPTVCLLCHSNDTDKYHQDCRRIYIRCHNCDLIHVPPKYHLSPEKEKMRYDLHQNSSNDLRYRSFLEEILNPTIEIVPRGSKGLDYGSGPEPVLTEMFRKKGFDMESYDLHYADNPDVLQKKYDFLVCCETIEHFSKPRKEWDRFLALTKPGGVIAVKTELMHKTRDFTKWHYIWDETHVCFFSEKTFQWLANASSLFVEYFGNTAIFQGLSR